jgi:hypothetical protein
MRNALRRTVTGLALAAATGAGALVAAPAAHAAPIYSTETRGCEWTTGVGQWWSVKADVTVGRDGSFGWIQDVTNVRTELTGFTLGVTESGSSSSGTVVGGTAVRISGASTLTYGVPTPWGSIDYVTLPVSCTTTWDVYSGYN